MKSILKSISTTKSNGMYIESKEKFLTALICARVIITILVVVRYLWFRADVSELIDITCCMYTIVAFLIYISILSIINLKWRDLFFSDICISIQMFVDLMFFTAFYVLTLNVESDVFMFYAVPILVASLKDKFNHYYIEILNALIISLTLVITITAIWHFVPEQSIESFSTLCFRTILPRIVFVWGLFYISNFIFKDRKRVFSLLNEYQKATEEKDAILKKYNKTISEKDIILNNYRKTSNERDAILNSIGEYVFAINREHEILWANDKYKKDFSKKYNEKLETGNGKLCYKKYHDSGVICDGCVSIQAMKKDRIVESERTWIKNNKSTIYRITASPFKNENGEIVGAVEVLLDITETKRLQKIKDEQSYLLKIIESSTDAIIVTDKKGNIEICNKGTLDLLGYSDETIKTMTSGDILCGENGEKGNLVAINVMKKLIMSTDDKIFNYQTYFKAKEGTVIPIGFTASIIQDEKEGIMGVVGIGRDKREFERLEAERLRYERLAAVGCMARFLAHNLKNKLGTLQLDAECLSDNSNLSLNENERDCLRRIVKVVKDVDITIKGVLTGSAIRIDKRKVSFREIEKKISGEFTIICSTKKIILDIVISRKLPDIYIDLEQLMLVFNTLLNNSIDAMESLPSGTIKVRAKTDGERIIIRWSDNGCGIPKGKYKKIFEYYTSKAEGKGSGMGLPMAKYIIQKHGGNISIDKTVQKGSGFILTLPKS